MNMFKKISLIPIFFFSTLTHAAHYSIIIDAGSSGSRLHLFEIESKDNYPTITEKFHEDTKPGISSFADHPENAPLSLQKMLDDADAKIKSLNADPKNVSVSLLATAGMRLVPEDKQQAIYSNIKDYLKNHYTFDVNHIETISGKMEGVYDWLDVNYLENTFLSDAAPYGSIDMGGASTQIAFATTDTSKPDDEVVLNVNNKRYTVFSKSFLGLGIDQARLSMNKDTQAGACYPTGYSAASPNLTGNYNFTNCSIAYENVISQYDVAKQIMPYYQTTFAVFSGAYYTYNFFGVEDNTQEALESRINYVCSDTWDILQKEYNGDKYLNTYCANGIFLDQLFYKNYQLQGLQMWVTSKSHHGQDIDWALGAMFYQFLLEGK